MSPLATEEILAFFSSARKEINQTLQSLLPQNSLAEVCHYSLFSGGKRFRPLLTLATAESLGVSWKKALLPACAIELVHTYSMIHDDLPCMDNDDFRRGKPTCHRAFSEWQALLAGDALLTLSFELLSTIPETTAEQRIEWVALLSQAAGLSGMIEGQTLDLLGKGAHLSKDQIRQIHLKKTGQLITAAILFGAVAAQATREIKQNLFVFGQHLGLAFQLRDDILDITQGKIKTQAISSSDLRNQTATAVTVLDITQAKAWAKQEFQEANHLLSCFTFSTELLKALVESLLTEDY